ncbi:MAG: AAA family ATPase [Chloroflexi bacterium]|nr:AAA family ATPase [Chloroflexota bacterium]
MKPPRIYFLGTAKFEIDGKPVELPAAKSIALLAFLAVNHEPQSRDRLLGLLWAESSDEAARKNLRNALWSIRKTLGEDVLQTESDKLMLDDSVWVDVREFEKTSKPSALSLYRGPLLDGFSLDNASDYEIWLTGERERLAQLLARALDSLVKAQRAKNDWRVVIETAQRALAFDNLQEPMYRALMEAHARLGERADALRQYDSLVVALERELGVEPLSETKELRAAIVTGSVGANRPSTLLRASQDDSLRKKPSPIRFVGREKECAALDEELATVRQGNARIALLVGELGIGKSRLWKEWSSGISGATILQARCLQSTQALPFTPVVELFNNRTVMQKFNGPSSPIAPVWLAQVARLIPGFASTIPNLPKLSALPAEEERQRLFEALAQCVIALGASPLVVFIDDVHWADRATLDWLDYLVHRLEHHPVLLIVAYRNEDATSTLVRFVAGWGREGLTRRISLERLTPEQSAMLVASLGGDPLLAARAQSQSAGNPYFLIELYRAPSGSIPSALNDLVRARVDTLPETARQVVQAAAILQSDFDFALLRRTSGRGEEETVQALDTLIGANILAEREAEYEFAHPLVAAIVRDGLSGTRRAFLHRRAADALESTFAGRLASIAARLAEHYAHANDSKNAARFAELAGEHALMLASPHEAADFYRRALELEATPSRQMGLGRALLRAGELDLAQHAFGAALDDFESIGDQKNAARAALSLSETFFPSGRFDEGARWMEKAFSFLGGASDPEGHALAHLSLASRTNRGELSEASEQHAQEAIRIADENDLPAIAARAYLVLGNLLAEKGDLSRANQAYRQTIAQAQVVGDDYQQVLGYNNLAYHSLLAGDLETARESVKQGLALSESRGLQLPLQYLYSTSGEIALAEKKWNEAEDWFNRGLVQAQAHHNREQTAGYNANLALVARGRGDLDGALVLLEQAQRQAASLTAPHLQTQIDLWLTELYLERGERAAALEALARAQARLADGTRRKLIEWAQRLQKQL